MPIASAGRDRSAYRVGTGRATRATSAETPMIAANQPAGAHGRKPPAGMREPRSPQSPAAPFVTSSGYISE
jgi:hypothetical protein